MDELKEASVRCRYGRHLWGYFIVAWILWMTTGAATPEAVNGERGRTAQTSIALIAVVHSLYVMLLLRHSRGRRWPTPDTQQGRYDKWHEALDKSGSFIILWLLVLVPVMAIQKFVNPQAELAEGLSATLVGLLTVGGAYAALGDFRPALHTATGGEHRNTRLKLPSAWPTRTLTALAFLALWSAAFALGHHLQPIELEGGSDEGASRTPGIVAVAR